MSSVRVLPSTDTISVSDTVPIPRDRLAIWAGLPHLLSTIQDGRISHTSNAEYDGRDVWHPPQMWMQPPAAPAQPLSMDVDDNTSQSTEPKFLSMMKKCKGKKKVSEVFMHHQEVQEVEKSLAQVLQHVEEAGLDLELVHLANDSDATQMLVENLLTHLDILRNELRQSEQASVMEQPLVLSYFINHASPILSNELSNTSVWMLWNCYNFTYSEP